MKSIKYLMVIMVVMLALSCGDTCEFKSITNESMPDGQVGIEYYQQINYDITCSYASKFASLKDGKLPDGIELKGTGEIIGTPTKAGTFTFVVNMQMCFASNGFEYTDCHDKAKEFTIKVLQ